MIPLSGSKSPKVDHFYATLRSLKAYPLQPSKHREGEEQNSIQHIRSLGKQILGQRNGKRGQMQKTLNQSKQSVQHRDNLYDKYVKQTKTKNEKLVECRKQKIMETTGSSQQKLWKNKKYGNIGSKLQPSTVIKSLNYVKRTDLKAQQIRKVKVDKGNVDKQMKRRQEVFAKNTSRIPTGLIQRGIQMEMRKSLSIEKIREEKRAQEMHGVTFTPIRVSKDLLKNNSKGFMYRMNRTGLLSLSKQKQLLTKTLSSNAFRPYINSHKQVESVVKQMWATAEEEEEEERSELSEVRGKNQEEEQVTMNSTTRITLRNMDQLSFMLE